MTKPSDLVTLNEQDETPTDESSESPEKQTQEQDAGTEEALKPSVKVPEKFQVEVSAIVGSATMAELDFLRSSIMQRESTLRKAETKPEKSGTFDVEGMPE